MKKVLLAFIAIMGMTAATQVQAQTALKIGVLNSEEMIQYLPEFRTVDSLVTRYSQDSLGSQFEIYQSEYHRLDSTYKADSAAKASQAKLNYTLGERNKNAQILINWQRYAQQMQQAKYQQLAQPLVIKVSQAVQKVCAERHIAFVLRPDAFDFAPQGSTIIEDISYPVAKALGLPVNDPAPAANGASTPATTPRRK